MTSLLTNGAHGLRDMFALDHPFYKLCQRTLGRRFGWTIYTKGSLRFLVDHHSGDQNGTRDCLISPMYRELFLHMDLPDSIRLLDLGANIGGFPLLCLDLGFTLAELTCVEVNPHTHARLLVNIRHNVGLHANVLNAAVGGRERRLSLSFPKGGTAFSIYDSSAGSSEAMIEVLPLDTIVARGMTQGPIHLCKMDVERAEYETFLEGSTDCLRYIHYLIMEIHPAEPERQAALRKKLSNSGFDLIHTSAISGDVHLFANRAWHENSPSAQL